MYKILLLLAIFLSLGCQSKEKPPVQHDEVRKIRDSLEKNNFLEEQYQVISFPFNYSQVLLKEKYLELSNFKLKRSDLEHFYSGEDNARILGIFKTSIKDADYLFSLVAVNFNNYEGSGPAQIVFLSGGKLDQNEYKNTIFTPLGAWTPLLSSEFNYSDSSFNALINNGVKEYCIQSFILEENLDKTEVNTCTDRKEPIIKKLKFNSEFFGYDE